MFFPSMLTMASQGAEVRPAVIRLLRSGGLRDRFGCSRWNVQDRRLFRAPCPPRRICQTVSGELKRKKADGFPRTRTVSMAYPTMLMLW